MTEKEKEAIEYFKGLNNLYNSGVQLLKYTDSECEYSNILLNLIEKQQKEIENKDKLIEQLYNTLEEEM